ncbi:hypothetical protein LEMLEM_LOCUS24300, partial [Lemmus lemmus]
TAGTGGRSDGPAPRSPGFGTSNGVPSGRLPPGWRMTPIYFNRMMGIKQAPYGVG